MALRLLARPLDGPRARHRATRVSRLQDVLQRASVDARKALAVGESKPDASLPAPEFAAMTMLASQMLNLDEVLHK